MEICTHTTIVLMNLLRLFPLSFSSPVKSVLLCTVLAACSTSASESGKTGGSKISLASVSSGWGRSNSKYSELASGPLAGEIGAPLSAAAKKQAVEAEYTALEKSKSGEPILWQYSSTQNGKIVPYPLYQVGSSSCRRYIHIVSVDGVTRQAAGTACRDKEGVWTPLT